MRQPRVITSFALFVAAVATPGLAHAQGGNAMIGKSVYDGKCGGCHSLDKNRIGPAHRGVIGRKPGTVPGYAYSAAIMKLAGVWTPARLDVWLQGPQKVAPGNKMFLTVADPAARANIIAYLQSVSPSSTGTKPSGR